MKAIDMTFRPSRRAVLAGALGAGAAAMLPGLAWAVGDSMNRALAFDGDALLSADGTRLFSHDGGRTGSDLSSPGYTLSLATHRDRPGRVIAGLAAGGVAYSEDGGATWRVRNAGLPEGEISAVTIGARNPDLIYAAVRGDGLWKSEDAGENWALAMDRPWLNEAERDPLTLASVALETGMGGIWIYAGTEVGLTRVPDCFCRWQEVQPGNAMDALVSGSAPPTEAPLPEGEPIHALASAASAPERLYAALPSGVWVSEDAGVVWRQSSDGAASAVAVHPMDKQYIAAVIDGTLNLSRDGGATWTARAAG